MLPDVIVHCGALELGATSLNDPIVLAEILSSGTEARDRITKWQVYQQIPSLRHYALVSRDRPHIEVMNRVGANRSELQIIDGLDRVLALPALGLELPLAEIYRDVIG
jgi:Uma2 family endonuclease